MNNNSNNKKNNRFNGLKRNNNLNNFGNKRSGSKKQQQQPSSPLYHPSIFRFSCKGSYSVSSDVVGSAGVCRGLQSQIESVDHWRLSTREEAIDVFTKLNDSPSFDGDPSSSASSSSSSSSPSPTSPNPTPSSPTSSGASQAHALSATLVSQVLVYPPSKKDNDRDNDNDNNKNKTKKSLIKRAPSSGNELIHQQEWNCHGSTEIDLLVLREQGKQDEQIVAVAPYCSPGLNVRDVTTQVGQDRTYTLRLGFLEIVFVTEQEQQSSKQQQQQHNQGNSPFNNNNNNNGKQGSSSSSSPSSSPGDNNHQPISFTDRFINSSLKIFKHMKLTAVFLGETLNDDFPNRTYSASQNIVKHFGITFDRTIHTMNKLIKYWSGSSSNSGGDDHGRSGK